MERTRTPVGAAGWLWVTLAVAAMGFSLVHTLVDFALIALESRFGVQQSLLSVLIGLLYTWWAWVFAKAVGGTKSWLVGLHGSVNHGHEHHGYDGNHHRHHHRYDNGNDGHRDWHKHHRHDHRRGRYHHDGRRWGSTEGHHLPSRHGDDCG
jgi:hypothetical protein